MEVVISPWPKKTVKEQLGHCSSIFCMGIITIARKLVYLLGGQPLGSKSGSTIMESPSLNFTQTARNDRRFCKNPVLSLGWSEASTGDIRTEQQGPGMAQEFGEGVCHTTRG